MLNVGDKVTERVVSTDSMMTGTVMYVHPDKYYYTVEFKGLFGSFRESFFFPLIPINEQVPRGGFRHWK